MDTHLGSLGKEIKQVKEVGALQKEPKNKSVNQLEYSAGMNWKRATQLGFDSKVVSILRQGWNPEICAHQRSTFRNNKSARDFPEVVKGQIDLLLQKSRIEIIDRADTEQYWDINPLTLVRKPGKDRLCIDTGRVLNKTIPTKKFKIRSVMHRLRHLRTGIWLAKIDLKNGYLHIPLHEDFRKYCSFEWDSRIYRYRWLPFGINDAPRVFQAITNEVCLSLQREGHLTEVYLDDFWIEADTEEKCLASTLKALERLEEIGLTPNRAKSQLQPTQRMTYLGINWDTKLGKAKLTDEYIQGIQALMDRAKPLVNRKGSAKVWRKLLGKFAFATQLDSRLKPFLMKAYKQIGTAAERDLIKIGSVSWKLLEKAMELLPLSAYETTKAKTLVITSDASAAGGAYWDDATEQDSSFEWDSKRHSSHTELFTAIKALRARARRGQNNILRTDNKATEAILNGGSSTKDNLNGMVVSLSEWAILNNIRFSASYIKGDLNHRADKASRRGNTKLVDLDSSVTIATVESKELSIKSRLFKLGNYWPSKSNPSELIASVRNTPPGSITAPASGTPFYLPIRTATKPLQSVLEYHLQSLDKPGYFKKSATALIYNTFMQESLLQLVSRPISEKEPRTEKEPILKRIQKPKKEPSPEKEPEPKKEPNPKKDPVSKKEPESKSPKRNRGHETLPEKELNFPKRNRENLISRKGSDNKVVNNEGNKSRTPGIPTLQIGYSEPAHQDLQESAALSSGTIAHSHSPKTFGGNKSGTSNVTELRILEGLQNIPKEVDLDKGELILPTLSPQQLLLDRKTIWRNLLEEQPMLRQWKSSTKPNSKDSSTNAPLLQSLPLETNRKRPNSSSKSSHQSHSRKNGGTRKSK